MRGCELRANREMEASTFAAWQIARMTHYGGKKLLPLGDYLKELSGHSKAQTADEMIALLRVIIPGAAN